VAWEGLGCRYEAAMALVLAGDDDALTAAHARFVAAGGTAAAAVVARRLRERGIAVARGPDRGSRSGPAGLTPRELDVALLIAQGLRNAEIAGRVHLSLRTVEHHAAAVMRKLGVHNRTEVAAAVRSGLAEHGDPAERTRRGVRSPT